MSEGISSNSRILTSAGFEKFWHNAAIGTLYRFKDPSIANKVKAVEQAILLEQNRKGRVYHGDLKLLEEQIPQMPYLLKEGRNLRLATQQEVLQIQVKAFVTIGNDLDRQGNHSDAIGYYKRSLKIAYDLHDLEAIAGLCYNIADSLDSLEKYDQALEYFGKSFEIASNQGIKNLIGKSSNRLGDLYDLRDRYPTALKYFKIALEIALEEGCESDAKKLYCSIGDVRFSLEDYKQALHFYELYKDAAFKLNDQRGIEDAWSRIVQVGKVLF